LYYALCLSYHSNTEAALFAYLSSGWATTADRLLGPKVGNSIKCLSQGHRDALPHRESSQGFAFLTSGPDLGAWPDYWVSVKFFHAPIPRKGSGSTTTTTTGTKVIHLTWKQNSIPRRKHVIINLYYPIEWGTKLN